MDGNLQEERYTALCRQLVQWAKNQSPIQVVLLIGSRARLNHPGDEWSDLDLVIFTNDLQPYKYWPWLPEIGDIFLYELDTTGRGDPEWIVVLADGMKVDFAFVQIPKNMSNQVDSLETLLFLTDDYREVYERGLICLVNRYNPAIENQSIQVHQSHREIPSQEQLLACIQGFLIEALRTTKFIRRKDVWRAVKSCNLLVQDHLLILVEWQARTTQKTVMDTWYDGRFLDDWADPWFIDMLPGLSAGYDLQQLNRSLQNAVHCAERLTLDITSALDLEFPHSMFSHARRLMDIILVGRE